MVCTSRAHLLSGWAGHVYDSPQASAARRACHGWYSCYTSTTGTFSFLRKNFSDVHFVIVTLYARWHWLMIRFLSKVEQQRLKFLSDRIVAQTELRKKLGQLLYLNNLAKVQHLIRSNLFSSCFKSFYICFVDALLALKIYSFSVWLVSAVWDHSSCIHVVLTCLFCRPRHAMMVRILSHVQYAPNS